MKIEYRGYTIDVTATRHVDGLWGAKILIWPINETTTALRQHNEIEGYSNKVEAEHAGLQWGRKQLNLYAQNKLPRH
jgi:hypothetical protein